MSADWHEMESLSMAGKIPSQLRPEREPGRGAERPEGVRPGRYSYGRSGMKDPGFEKVYSRYQKSVGFNQQIDLYNTVENNENFFIGKGLPM